MATTEAWSFSQYGIPEIWYGTELLGVRPMWFLRCSFRCCWFETQNFFMFSNHRGVCCGMGGMGCLKKKLWTYGRLWCFCSQFLFFWGEIYTRVYGRNQPHQLIWRDSQYFCNQAVIYFQKLAIKKPYFRTISRPKIIQFPPEVQQQTPLKNGWLEGVCLSYSGRKVTFQGVNSLLNFRV